MVLLKVLGYTFNQMDHIIKEIFQKTKLTTIPDSFGLIIINTMDRSKIINLMERENLMEKVLSFMEFFRWKKSEWTTKMAKKRQTVLI